MDTNSKEVNRYKDCPIAFGCYDKQKGRVVLVDCCVSSCLMRKEPDKCYQEIRKALEERVKTKTNKK